MARFRPQKKPPCIAPHAGRATLFSREDNLAKRAKPRPDLVLGWSSSAMNVRLFPVLAASVFAVSLRAAALATVTSGPGTLPPRPPDATYAYELTVAGTTFGTFVVAVRGTPSGTILVNESASVPPACARPSGMTRRRTSFTTSPSRRRAPTSASPRRRR
jgi:hypothetical protein